MDYQFVTSQDKRNRNLQDKCDIARYLHSVRMYDFIA